MKETIKERFIASFDFLYQRNHFKNKKSFAESLDISPQFLSQLLNGPTPVPLELLSNFFATYPVNPGYFFKNEQNILLSEQEESSGASTNSSSADDLEVARLLNEAAQTHLKLVELIKRMQLNNKR